MTLLAPLLAALGALPDILENDIGWCFSAAALGQVKLGCLTVIGVLGDDDMPLLDYVLEGVCRCIKGHNSSMSCMALLGTSA
jgi:hypothetical protein